MTKSVKSQSAHKMQVGTIADAGSELGQWEQSFRDHVADIPPMKIDQLHYNESAERLRKLLQSGLLRQTDLRDHPDRFFIAHRIMSEWATRLGPGFGIRFTVQVHECPSWHHSTHTPTWTIFTIQIDHQSLCTSMPLIGLDAVQSICGNYR